MWAPSLEKRAYFPVIQYSNWEEKSPNSEPGSCVRLSASPHDDPTDKGRWIDETCLRKNLVVCERTLKRTEQNKENNCTKSVEDLIKDLAYFKDRLQTLEGRVSKVEKEQRNKTILDSKQNCTVPSLVAPAIDPLPLGFVYVQLPKEKEPSILWPSLQWADISATYAGVFFRVLGGNSEPFGVLQNDHSPRIDSVVYKDCKESDPNDSKSCDRSRPKNEVLMKNMESDGWTMGVTTANFYSSDYSGKGQSWTGSVRFHTSQGEVRPVNMAVKVWQRIG